MNKTKKFIEVLSVILLMLPLILMSSCTESAKSSQLVIETLEEEVETYAFEEYAEICVYVVGEVVNPGVYTLKEGSRVCDVIDEAGGFTENAAKEYINLASKVSDGEKIIVYSVTQINEGVMLESQSSLVNINTADADKLMTLPGIGEARANDIIKYREKNGRFETIEDIMKVSGIKEAAFSKIEDLITVN